MNFKGDLASTLIPLSSCPEPAPTLDNFIFLLLFARCLDAVLYDIAITFQSISVLHDAIIDRKRISTHFRESHTALYRLSLCAFFLQGTMLPSTGIPIVIGTTSVAFEQTGKDGQFLSIFFLVSNYTQQ